MPDKPSQELALALMGPVAKIDMRRLAVSLSVVLSVVAAFVDGPSVRAQTTLLNAISAFWTGIGLFLAEEVHSVKVGSQLDRGRR
jgi:hypothetical protein